MQSLKTNLIRTGIASVAILAAAGSALAQTAYEVLTTLFPVRKATYEGRRASVMHYAWRDTGQTPGKALAWWLDRLRSDKTRSALLEQHEGLLL